MTYTTQGLMTPMDLADNAQLYDTHRHPYCPGHGDGYCSAAEDCPAERVALKGSPMDTFERLTMYLAWSNSGRCTPAQRRRLLKKAGRDPMYLITRTDKGVKILNGAEV